MRLVIITIFAVLSPIFPAAAQYRTSTSSTFQQSQPLPNTVSQNPMAGRLNVIKNDAPTINGNKNPMSGRAGVIKSEAPKTKVEEYPNRMEGLHANNIPKSNTVNPNPMGSRLDVIRAQNPKTKVEVEQYPNRMEGAYRESKGNANQDPMAGRLGVIRAQNPTVQKP